MGSCWGDNVMTGQMYEVTKTYKESGDPTFYKKNIRDQDVMHEIEQQKIVN